MQGSDSQEQRRAARRTAWILGVIAALIFSVFMLSGILGKG